MLATRINEYARLCSVEVDVYNRKNGEGFTIYEARKAGLLSYNSFDAYLEFKEPGMFRKRRERAQRAKVEQVRATMPLRDRLKLVAVADLTLVLKAYQRHLEDLEAEMAALQEIEWNEQMQVGVF